MFFPVYLTASLIGRLSTDELIKDTNVEASLGAAINAIYNLIKLNK